MGEDINIDPLALQNKRIPWLSDIELAQHTFDEFDLIQVEHRQGKECT